MAHQAPPSLPDNAFNRWFLRQPAWARTLLVIAVFGLCATPGIIDARKAITAERVRITVESCEDRNAETGKGCQGTWTLADGVTVTGPVEGPLKAEEQVEGWGTCRSATADLWTWLTTPIMTAAVLLIALGAIVLAAIAVVRRRR